MACQRSSSEPRAPPPQPARTTQTTVRSSPRVRIHGARQNDASENSSRRPLDRYSQENIKNFGPLLRESLSEIQARHPTYSWGWKEGLPISNSWEILQHLQSEFYEGLRAEMITEHANLRQDMLYGLAQIKSEFLSELDHKYEANSRKEAQHHQYDLEALVDCVRKEVHDAVSKMDVASQIDIASMVDSLVRIETSIRKIDVKPEVTVDLRPIEGIVGSIESKVQVNMKPAEEAIRELDVKSEVRFEALQNAVTRMECSLRNQTTAPNLTPVLDAIKASQLSPTVTLSPMVKPPNVDLSPVLETIDKLHASIAAMNDKHVKDCVMIRSKQDEVIAVVRDLPESKFQIDVSSLMDWKPLTEATTKIDRKVEDIVRRISSKQDDIFAAISDGNAQSKEIRIDFSPLVEEMSKKPQVDLQLVMNSIEKVTTQIHNIDAVQRTNARQMFNELATLNAKHLDHKFVIDTKSGVDLKPVLHAVAKLEQKIDMMSWSNNVSGLEKGSSSVLTLSGTSVATASR